MNSHCSIKVSKGAKISTTPDPGYQWESDKLTVRHHKQEPRGQPLLLLINLICSTSKIFTERSLVLLDFSLTVKAAPHECVIRTSQP